MKWFTDRLDRYNKGQDKYEIGSDERGVFYYQDGFRTVFISIYELVFNSAYGFLDTFHKDKDWQKEFWEWMEEGGNASKSGNYLAYGKIYPLCGNLVKPTSQMLVGYIKEFIESHILEQTK